MDRQLMDRDDWYGVGSEGEGTLPPREGVLKAQPAGDERATQPKRRSRRGGKRAAARRAGKQAAAKRAGEQAVVDQRAGERAEGTRHVEEQPSTGHAAHFLSRLDRVKRDEVDFALGLYRDPELVRMLLARAALPEGYQRAAISLDDPREGPFLVVTRAGHFVTCLGRGMSPRALPVVTREKLEAALTAASDQRARSQVLDERVALAGGSGKLIARIVERADWLSREEFVAISALQPLLAPRLLQLYVKVATELGESQREFTYVLRRERPTRRLVPALRSYWKQLWSLGHLLTLSTMGDRRWLIDFLGAASKAPGLERLSVSWPLVRHGIAPLAMRGAWAMGRTGKALIGCYKGAFAANATPLQTFDATLALGAIGLRNARAQAEIHKVMGTAAARVDLNGPPRVCDTLQEYCSVLGSTYASLFDSIFEASPEAFDRYAVAVGRRALMAKLDALPAGLSRPFGAPKEVPEDLARTAFLDLDGDYVGSPEAAIMCIVRLGAVARMRAEDFYYPEAILPYVRRRWRPEHTVEMIDRMNGEGGPRERRRVRRARPANERFAWPA
jgi:hypothetical protein